MESGGGEREKVAKSSWRLAAGGAPLVRTAGWRRLASAVRCVYEPD